jgi:hypothetical protein
MGCFDIDHIARRKIETFTSTGTCSDESSDDLGERNAPSAAMRAGLFRRDESLCHAP